MPGHEMATQSCMSVRADADTLIEPEEMSERLENFWFSLPRPKTLREKGISRLKQRKSNTYLNDVLRNLVETSIQAENDEEERLKEKELDELKQLKKKPVLSSLRCMDSEAEYPVDLKPKGNFTSMPRSWAEDAKELEDDLKDKVKHRFLALKPKILTSPIPKKDSFGLTLEDVQNTHSAICNEALKKTISADRKKKIKADLSEMDLWNRPMHHLSTPLIDKKLMDPLDGAESMETMYSNVKRKVSAETLNNLLNPEPDIEEVLQEYFKTHGDSASAHQKEFHTKVKANLSRRPRVPDDQSTVESGSETSTFADYGMDPTASSGFGLHCLRELVKFQDDGWNFQDSDGYSDDQPSGSSITQKEASVWVNNAE